MDLHYDLTAATNNGTSSTGGFDGKGDSLPAEMLPTEIIFDDVHFHLADAHNAAPDALVAKGQTISLPRGPFNRVYILAASADGDQKANFEVGGKSVALNIQDWGGFIGQWDDRQWTSKETLQDDYGEMTGLKPGYIKRADLAWYSSHHHDPAGKNVAYSYSYLFAYGIDLPPGARTLQLPDDDKILVMAVSVAKESPQLKSAQPLYDVLPPKP